MQKHEHSVVSKYRRVLYSIVLCGIAVATVCTVCSARVSKGSAGMIKGVRTADAAQAAEAMESPGKVTMTFFDVPLSDELQQYLFQECARSGVPAELAVAVMSAESNYQPDAVSATHDYGLMQINRVNHKWLSDELEISDFLDPKQNISAGVYLLNDLWDRYGNYNDVLMAYNLGIGGAARAKARGVTSTPYSEKVLSIMQSLNYCTRVIDGVALKEDGKPAAGAEPVQEEEPEDGKMVLTSEGELQSVATLPSSKKKSWPKAGESEDGEDEPDENAVEALVEPLETDETEEMDAVPMTELVAAQEVSEDLAA